MRKTGGRTVTGKLVYDEARECWVEEGAPFDTVVTVPATLGNPEGVVPAKWRALADFYVAAFRGTNADGERVFQYRDDLMNSTGICERAASGGLPVSYPVRKTDYNRLHTLLCDSGYRVQEYAPQDGGGGKGGHSFPEAKAF